MKSMFISVLLLVVACLSAGFPTQQEESEAISPSNGKYLEGDIALEPSRVLAQLETFWSQSWPNGVIPYTIDPNYSSAHKSVIESAMRMIEEQTRLNGVDCVKFIPRTFEANYVRIFPGQGCWSYVGKNTNAGPQDLSLQMPFGSSTISCIFKGTVMHELLHALGFWHEHSRPDRDNYLNIYLNNVEESQRHNFDKKVTETTMFDLSYDYDSVMHYESNAFSINGLNTMLPKKSQVVLLPTSKKNRLTDNDIQGIRKLYKCAA